jgi:hypothetical protein
MKERLLFVTKGGEGCDDGFSYVLELAKTLNADILVLMLYGKRTMDTYEDVMAAVAFAEAGEVETVRELMNKQIKDIKGVEAEKINEMARICRENSIDFSYQVEVGDTVSGIRDFLKTKPGIDMVLLSPSLSSDRKGIDLKKLIKTITKPIVTINRPAGAEA